MKHSAWKPCPKCKHSPQEPEDVAKHLITTDHYFSRADLEAMANRVKNGEPLDFDPKNVADIVASIKTSKPDDKGLKRFVSVYFKVLGVLLAAAILFALYSVARFLMK